MSGGRGDQRFRRGGTFRRAARSAVPSEKVEQGHVIQLAVSLGGKVYVLGTRRPRGKACPKCGTFVEEYQGTRQTPGISDLLIFLPIRGAVEGQAQALLVFDECKKQGGQLSPAQREFREWCRRAAQHHISGGLDAFIAFTVAQGLTKATQFAHYRQPPAVPAEV